MQCKHWLTQHGRGRADKRLSLSSFTKATGDMARYYGQEGSRAAGRLNSDQHCLPEW